MTISLRTCVTMFLCLTVGSQTHLLGDEPTVVPVLVNVLDQVEVSPQEPGVLIEVAAHEGQQFKRGDILAQIDDTQERFLLVKARLELEIAAKNAASEIGILTTQKSMEVAKAMYERARAAKAKVDNSIPQSELERLRLEADKSDLAVRQATHDQELAGIEHTLKEAEVEFASQRVERRKIVAPFDGMVVEVKGRRGEWIQPGDKVIRLIRLDRLRVEGFIPARTARRGLEGSSVRLKVEMPGRTEAHYTGKLVFVSPEVDPVNNQVRVFANIENPDRTLRPGLKGTLFVQPAGTR